MLPARPAPVLLLLALAGCPSGGPAGDDDTTATDDDTGDDDTSPAVVAEAELSEEAPAVIRVSWTLEGLTHQATWAAFGTEGELDRKAVAVPGMEGGYEALVWGVKPGSEVTIRAVAEADGEEYASESLTVTTGYPPAHLPEAEVTVFDAGTPVGGYLVTSVISDPSTAVVVDSDGDYVWWHSLDEAYHPLLISRAKLSLDGRTVLYLASSTPTGGGATQLLVRVPFDGVAPTLTEVAGAHHDFAERDDGTMAMIALDTRDVDGEQVQGDRIVEVVPDGTTTEIWTAWDHLTYDPDEPEQPGTGWTHANALDHDPEADVYHLTLRNRDAILAIDRNTGDLLYTVGDDGDFALDGGSTDLFDWPHQFQVLDGSLLAFSSGSAPWFRSEALEYTLDKDTGLAELVWSYTADPPLFSVGYGDASRLPGGHTLITWSAQGQIDEVDEAGANVWRLNLGLGGGLGYTTHVTTLPGLER